MRIIAFTGVTLFLGMALLLVEGTFSSWWHGYPSIPHIVFNFVLLVMAIGGFKMVHKAFPRTSSISALPGAAPPAKHTSLQLLFVGSLIFAFAPAIVTITLLATFVGLGGKNAEGFGAIAIVVGAITLLPGLLVAIGAGIALFFTTRNAALSLPVNTISPTSASSLINNGSKHLILIGLMVVIAGSVAWWVFMQMPTRSFTSVVTESPTRLQNPNAGSQGRTNSSSQTTPTSNTRIKVIYPSGAEVLKIGNTVLVTWEAQNVPSGAQLDLELFEISDKNTSRGTEGQCINCVGGGLQSGISAISVQNGAGSAEWVVGKLYSGGYVSSGSHYILKATVSRIGSNGECPTKFPTCVVDLSVDWSDSAFSLTN